MTNGYVPTGENGLGPIIGESPALARVVALARQIAPTHLPVLLVGPTGCGKELFAQHIHRWSGRRGRVIPINCAALPEQLAEAELFGHDAQAFTGARRAKPGLIEVAEGGTFFLDEILSLPLDVQAKLLRVVEAGEVWRVGETQARPVDVRFVAAAQEDLSDRVRDRRFRADLLQRFAGMMLQIPPLAERPEDIVPLARHFGQLLGRELEPGAERVLERQAWPGNVRELKLTVQRAAGLMPSGPLSVAALAEAMTLGIPDVAGPEPAEAPLPTLDMPVEHLRAFFASYGWNTQQIAAALGLGRTTLFLRLRERGLSLRMLRRISRARSVHSVQGVRTV